MPLPFWPKEHEQVELDMMRRDSQNETSRTKTKTDTRSGYCRYFIDGGTGFFGPFIVKSLLEQTSDDIYVIV